VSALLPLAVLAPDMRTAHHWVRQEEVAGRLGSFRRTEASGQTLVLGVVRPFRLVTSVDHLRGLEVIGFVTQGLVPIALVEAARLQVRR